MTLVVPLLDNMFTVLLISEVAKIGATKPIFLASGSLGEGGSVCVGKVCYEYIVHILKSNKNSIFFTATSNLCRAMLILLEDIFLCFVPN